jgi:uncharacterized membrane protein
MADTNTGQSKAKPSLIANPFYWISVGPTLVFSMLALFVSWPLGPSFIDEGGITKVRIAISLVAVALFFGVLFMVTLLCRIITHIENLMDQLPRLTVRPDQKS